MMAHVKFKYDYPCGNSRWFSLEVHLGKHPEEAALLQLLLGGDGVPDRGGRDGSRVRPALPEPHLLKHTEAGAGALLGRHNTPGRSRSGAGCRARARGGAGCRARGGTGPRYGSLAPVLLVDPVLDLLEHTEPVCRPLLLSSRLLLSELVLVEVCLEAAGGSGRGSRGLPRGLPGCGAGCGLGCGAGCGAWLVEPVARLARPAVCVKTTNVDVTGEGRDGLAAAVVHDELGHPLVTDGVAAVHCLCRPVALAAHRPGAPVASVPQLPQVTLACRVRRPGSVLRKVLNGLRQTSFELSSCTCMD